MVCLDVGCGGGDVTLEIARAVGADGLAVGWDIDEIALEMARAEAAEQQLHNTEFMVADATSGPGERLFDAVYARFLLTHLSHPEEALANMLRATRPGGVLILEDIDFRGSFCYPESAAFDRYVELYTQSVLRRR